MKSPQKGPFFVGFLGEFPRKMETKMRTILREDVMEKPLIIRKIFHTSRENLYELFTNKEKMTQWFFDQDYFTADIKMDLQESGPLSVEILTDIGAHHPHNGEFFRIVPNHKLVFSWETDTLKDSMVTLVFDDIIEGKESCLSLLQTGLHTLEEATENREFWLNCFRHLEDYIADPLPFAVYNDPDYDQEKVK